MKIKIILALLLGLILGGFLGGAIANVSNAKNTGTRMRYAQELAMLENGERAFEYYQKETPEMGVLALQFQINEMENKADWNGPTIFAQDINWWRALAHARMSVLYDKMGKTELSTAQLSLAAKLLSPGKIASILPTTTDSLLKWVKEADEKHSWL